MRRFGQAIRVKPDRIADYEALHAAPWPGVLAALARADVRNYSIFRHGTTLFAYYEHVGDDCVADMAVIADDAQTRLWWALTEPMQEPEASRPPGTWWLDMPAVFRVD